jgi:hypothetical protein
LKVLEEPLEPRQQLRSPAALPPPSILILIL